MCLHDEQLQNNSLLFPAFLNHFGTLLALFSDYLGGFCLYWTGQVKVDREGERDKGDDKNSINNFFSFFLTEARNIC